jgi:peroxiredoxin
MLRSGQAVPDALEQAEVIDRDGKTRRLGTLWEDGPAVLVFLRHFACIACTEHVAVLMPQLSTLEEGGVSVVFIGNGAPNFIEGFLERNDLDRGTEVLTDPSLSVFEMLGLERSRLSTYGPRAAVNAGRAMMRGFRQRSIEGDVLQQGGVLVVGRGGRVEYVHRDRVLGDHAPLAEVMAAAHAVADSRDRA